MPSPKNWHSQSGGFYTPFLQAIYLKKPLSIDVWKPMVTSRGENRQLYTGVAIHVFLQDKMNIVLGCSRGIASLRNMSTVAVANIMKTKQDLSELEIPLCLREAISDCMGWNRSEDVTIITRGVAEPVEGVDKLTGHQNVEEDRGEPVDPVDVELVAGVLVVVMPENN